MTANEHDKEYTDAPSPEAQHLSSARLFEENPPISDSSTPSPEKGQVIPSSKIEGSVLLRYTPRNTKAGGSDSSTNV